MQGSPVPATMVWRRLLPVAAGAAAANAALWGLGTLAGADLRIPESPGGDQLQDLSIVPVLVVTVGALVLATLLLSVLLRAFGPRGVLYFNLTAVGLCLLSLAAPLMLAIGWGGKVLLVLMHLVVGAAAFFGLGRSILR
jgi:uncharacterized membrane protein